MRVVAVSALLLVGLAALLAHEHAELDADWHGLVARARANGLRLEGDTHDELAWPGLVLDVRQPGLSAPAGISIRTAGITLVQAPFGGAGLGIRLDRPLAIADGPARAELHGRAIVLGVAGSGRITLAGDRLDVMGRTEGVTFVAPNAAATPSGGHTRVTLSAGRLSLPIAGLPEAERTLTGASVEATSAGTPCAPGLVIAHARADWLGVALQASGRLALVDGRVAGTVSVTLGSSWRRALLRAAHDGAITASEAQAAAGLLGLLGGATPVLPLAVDDGRVTLAGLLLARLPDLPRPSGCAAASP